MFGGVAKVPKNVQDAMKLQDYGKGKPLAARRIMAVAAAVQKDIALTKAANKLGFSGNGTAEIARFCLRDKSLLENADPAAEFKRNQSYVFSKNEKGDIRFGFELGSKGAILNMSNADGKYATKFDRGASFKYGFSGTIPKTKFDRFANADWAGLSDDKVREIKKLDQDMKKGWIDNIANGIPEPCRLEMENVDTTFGIVTDNPVNIG